MSFGKIPGHEKTIVFAFYDSKNATKSGNPVNRIMQYHQRYWHSETLFIKSDLPDDHPKKATGHSLQVVAYGVMTRNAKNPEIVGTVFEMDRFFDSQKYRFIACYVTPENYEKALTFARLQIGKPYDPSGHSMLLWNPRPSTVDSKSWYCTNLTAAIAVQALPVMREVHPGACSTDRLWEKISMHPHTYNFTPPSYARDDEKTKEDLRRKLKGMASTSGTGITRCDTNDSGKTIYHYS